MTAPAKILTYEFFEAERTVTVKQSVEIHMCRPNQSKRLLSVSCSLAVLILSSFAQDFSFPVLLTMDEVLQTNSAHQVFLSKRPLGPAPINQAWSHRHECVSGAAHV